MNISGNRHRNNIAFSAKLKILHVEDEPILQRTFARIVGGELKQAAENHGDTLELTMCKNPQEAEKALSVSKFDAIVTDGNLVDKEDGLTVINKALETHTPDKIIMYSGSAGLQDKVEALEASFIWKPDITSLKAKIKSILSRQK